MNRVEEAIKVLSMGQMVVLTDDEERENEGDLILPASMVRAEDVNFMITKARGLICVPMAAEDLFRLDIDLMCKENQDYHNTAFCVSVDHSSTSTGISAADRAATIRALGDRLSHSDDFNRPGHIFPLMAEPGGVLKRAGHTEGALMLSQLAGCGSAAAICEILHPDGTMAGGDYLRDFAREHHLVKISIADLIAYQHKLLESRVDIIEKATLPTQYGNFRIVSFKDDSSKTEPVALVKGNWTKDDAIPVRIHSECLTGDVFGSIRCDCGRQLEDSLRFIAKEGRGVLIYLRQEGRGIGLHNKIKAYALQDKGMDTVDANLALGFKSDDRSYASAIKLLKSLEVGTLRLISNNPEKIEAVESAGFNLTERINLNGPVLPENKRYLKTKKERMGHLLKV